MEELKLPYKLKWYKRGEDGLAPRAYLGLHPAATAPVIDDDGRVLCESAVIVEYICHRHAGGRLTLRPDQPDYPDYLYWMHFNNNILGLLFAKVAAGEGALEGRPATVRRMALQREHRYFNFLNVRLGSVPYLAGAQFTCADIMSMFALTSLPMYGARRSDDLPNVVSYVKRIESRPAYSRAMQIAGPQATPSDR